MWRRRSPAHMQEPAVTISLLHQGKRNWSCSCRFFQSHPIHNRPPGIQAGVTCHAFPCRLCSFVGHLALLGPETASTGEAAHCKAARSACGPLRRVHRRGLAGPGRCRLSRSRCGPPLSQTSIINRATVEAIAPTSVQIWVGSIPSSSTHRRMRSDTGTRPCRLSATQHQCMRRPHPSALVFNDSWMLSVHACAC